MKRFGLFWPEKIFLRNSRNKWTTQMYFWDAETLRTFLSISDSRWPSVFNLGVSILGNGGYWVTSFSLKVGSNGKKPGWAEWVATVLATSSSKLDFCVFPRQSLERTRSVHIPEDEEDLPPEIFSSIKILKRFWFVFRRHTLISKQTRDASTFKSHSPAGAQHLRKLSLLSLAKSIFFIHDLTAPCY